MVSQLGRLSDGTWSCTAPGPRTEPCGDCDGCRYIESVKRAKALELANSDDDEARHRPRYNNMTTVAPSTPWRLLHD